MIYFEKFMTYNNLIFFWNTNLHYNTVQLQLLSVIQLQNDQDNPKAFKSQTDFVGKIFFVMCFLKSHRIMNTEFISLYGKTIEIKPCVTEFNNC